MNTPPYSDGEGLVHSSGQEAASIPGQLVARLEVAQAGSRELSAQVIAATIAPAGAFARASSINGEWCVYSGADRTGQPRLWAATGADHRLKIDSVTQSLDAALALAERVLPGQARAMGDMAFDPPGRPWAVVWTKGGDPKFNAEAATPALALCIAILKATTANAVGTEKPQASQCTPIPSDSE